DGAPAIYRHKACRKNGHIIFDNVTFHVASVMRTTGPSLPSSSIACTTLCFLLLTRIMGNRYHLLVNGLPLEYQSGCRVTLNGHGTFNRNGQLWWASLVA
ncbi:hypothetical protein J132_11308, partial [Termitomyces sp. J132]